MNQSSSAWLYGISLVYGFAGSTSLQRIALAIAGSGDSDARQMLLTGLVFILFAAKLALGV